MTEYTVLYAEDVPHYALAEIEAATPAAAIAAAKAFDYSGLCAEPDWNNPVSRRIVHIAAPGGEIVAADIALDNWIAIEAPAPSDQSGVPLYSHAFTIAFELESPDRTGENVPPAAIRRALYTRLARLDDAELLEAVGLPDDTYEITNPQQGEPS